MITAKSKEKEKFRGYHIEILQHINKMKNHSSSLAIVITYIKMLSYLPKIFSTEFHLLKISVKSFHVTSERFFTI